MTTAKRQAVVDFFGYAVCDGQQNASALGDAPLPLNLTRAAEAALTRLHDADPALDVSALDVSRCENPTITHRAGGRVADGLRGQVAEPPACAAVGAGPCRHGA